MWLFVMCHMPLSTCFSYITTSYRYYWSTYIDTGEAVAYAKLTILSTFQSLIWPTRGLNPRPSAFSGRPITTPPVSNEFGLRGDYFTTWTCDNSNMWKIENVAELWPIHGTNMLLWYYFITDMLFKTNTKYKWSTKLKIHILNSRGLNSTVYY